MSITIGNPGFEANEENLNPWTTYQTGVGDIPTLSTEEGQGGSSNSCQYNYALEELQVGTSGIRQTVGGFVAGQNYTLTYYLNFPALVTLSLNFTANIGPDFSFPNTFINIGPTGWIEIVETFTPTTSDDMELEFELGISATVNIDGSMYLDNISIVPTALICFSPESQILTRTIDTGFIRETRADETYATTHEVYDVNNKKFVPIVHNAITGPTKRFMCIRKNALGPDQPSADFKVTSGHKVVVDGVETKAKKIRQAKRIRVKPTMLYTIVTEERQPIQINGLAVLAHGKEEWDAYVAKRKFAWKENKSVKSIKN